VYDGKRAQLAVSALVSFEKPTSRGAMSPEKFKDASAKITAVDARVDYICAYIFNGEIDTPACSRIRPLVFLSARQPELYDRYMHALELMLSGKGAAGDEPSRVAELRKACDVNSPVGDIDAEAVRLVLSKINGVASGEMAAQKAPSFWAAIICGFLGAVRSFGKKIVQCCFFS
jgi:hypothetical protein